MTAKTRLNKGHKETILEWMEQEKIAKSTHSEKVVVSMKKAILLINEILRKKYPEEDMVVLRKYKAVRHDYCIRFNIPEEVGLVFGFNISCYYNSELELQKVASETLADIPNSGGCNSNTVYIATKKIKEAIDVYDNARKDYETFYNKKKSEYASFVNTCRTLEDIESVIPLPADIRQRITGARSELAVINPEILESIADDFKPKKKGK